MHIKTETIILQAVRQNTRDSPAPHAPADDMARCSRLSNSFSEKITPSGKRNRSCSVFYIPGAIHPSTDGTAGRNRAGHEIRKTMQPLCRNRDKVEAASPHVPCATCLYGSSARFERISGKPPTDAAPTDGNAPPTSPARALP